MAANTPGVQGAMFDTNSTQAGLCTGIGVGINAVYAPAPPGVASLSTGLRIQRIGNRGVALLPVAQACGFAGKLVTAQKNNTRVPVPPGGAMADGSINQSGKSVPIGGAVMSVGATVVADPTL